MTKRRSINLFVVFSILLAILLVACFVNFTYPFPMYGTYYSYSNFVSNIRLGEDIGSSMRVVYRASLPEGEAQSNYNALKTSTINQLKDIIQSEGYKDVTVSSYDDKIVMQIGNILNETDETTITSLLENPQPAAFYIDAMSDENPPFATAEDINVVDVVTSYDQTTAENIIVVRVQFKEDKIDEIAELTAEGGTLYIYKGDTVYSQIDLGSSAIEEGVIYIQNSAFVDEATAQTYANVLRIGIISLDLTSIELSTITPSYGVGSDVMIPIAMAVFVLCLFIFMIVKYKQMGALACFNLLFFITIGLFILQSIPLAHYNFAGMIGMLLCLIISADSLMNIFERAKIHYQTGLQLHVAFKLGQRETLFKNLILNILTFAVGFVCVFIPNMAIQSFGWVALVLPIVNLFTSLVLMRLFINMYLPLNNTDGKKLNFHKGGENA